MERKTYHVIPALSGGWNVRKGGASRASKHFQLKEDAEAWGREASRKEGSELFIHRRDGMIQTKESPADRRAVLKVERRAAS
jgi:hypothetical protein